MRLQHQFPLVQVTPRLPYRLTRRVRTHDLATRQLHRPHPPVVAQAGISVDRLLLSIYRSEAVDVEPELVSHSQPAGATLLFHDAPVVRPVRLAVTDHVRAHLLGPVCARCSCNVVVVCPSSSRGVSSRAV